MPRQKIKRQLPLVRGPNAVELDLSSAVIVAKETRNGWMVFISPEVRRDPEVDHAEHQPQVEHDQVERAGYRDYHWTFVKDGDRFTIHSTWTEGDVRRHDTWLAVELPCLQQRLEDPVWFADIQHRLLSLHQPVEGPDWLRAIGANSLLPVPLDPLAGRELPDGTIDASDLAPIPLEAPWQGSAFEFWAVLDGTGKKMLGLLRTLADEHEQRWPFYIAWDHLLDMGRQLLPELLGPTGSFHEPLGPARG
jgi:hypothetical protein